MSRSTLKRIAENERRTAIHEAGHAVAFFIHRRLPKRMSLISGGDPLAHTPSGKLPAWVELDERPKGRTQLWLEDRIIECMAGEAALEVAGERDPGEGANWDRAFALDWAMKLCSDDEREVEACLAWLRIRTQNLLSGRRWELVEFLAEELLRRGEMTGHEVKAAIHGYTEARFGTVRPKAEPA